MPARSAKRRGVGVSARACPITETFAKPSVRSFSASRSLTATIPWQTDALANSALMAPSRSNSLPSPDKSACAAARSATIASVSRMMRGELESRPRIGRTRSRLCVRATQTVS
jgi:hypothetical protein